MPTAGEAKLGKTTKGSRCKLSSSQPAPAKRRQAKGKENIGTNVAKNSSAAVKQNVARKSKSKPAPNFSKLHKNWQSQLAQGKAVAKKPNTKIEAFNLCESNVKRNEFSEDSEETQCSHEVTEKYRDEQDENIEVDDDQDFQIDNNALEGILSNRGIQDEDFRPQGRATIAGFPQSAISTVSHARPPLKRTSIYYTGPSNAKQHVAPLSFASPLKPRNPQVLSKHQVAPRVKKQVAWADEENIQCNKGIDDTQLRTARLTPSRYMHRQQQETSKRVSIYYTGPRTAPSTRMTSPIATISTTATSAHAQGTHTGYCPSSTLVGVQGENAYCDELQDVTPSRPAVIGGGASAINSRSVPQTLVAPRSLPGRAKQTRTQASSQQMRWADVLTPQRAQENHQRVAHETPLEPLREVAQSEGCRRIAAVRQQAPIVSMATPVPQLYDYCSATPSAWSELRDQAHSPNSDPKMALCFDDVTEVESLGPDPFADLEKQAIEDLRLLEIEGQMELSRKEASALERKPDPQSAFIGGSCVQPPKFQTSTDERNTRRAPLVLKNNETFGTATDSSLQQPKSQVDLITAQNVGANEMPASLHGAGPDGFTIPGRNKYLDKNLPNPAAPGKKLQTPKPSVPSHHTRTNYPLTPGGLTRPVQTVGYTSAKYVTQTGSCFRMVNNSISTPFQSKVLNPGIESATSADHQSAFRDSSQCDQTQSSLFRSVASQPSYTTPSSMNGLLVAQATSIVTPTPVKPAEFAKLHAVGSQEDSSDSLVNVAISSSENVDIRPVKVASPTHKYPNRKRAAPEERLGVSLRGELPIRDTSLRSGHHSEANIASQYRWDVPTENPIAFRSISSNRPVSESFREALLDMEVTLLTGAYRSKDRIICKNRDLRNPLAKLFLEGDSQCFVPILE